MNFQLTPTTIITGFLGSGKTTIINHLIEYLQNQGERVAYIKNEIGDEDLDAKLMKGKYIEAKEVLGGCICCTLVGPFIKAINELVDTYQPDRIIVESAGTADPAALSLMVQDHPKLIRDGTVAIIDVQNFSGYKDLHDSAKRQAEMVDLLIFNKVEGVSLEDKRKVVGYVRELNEYSPIVEAPNGKVNPELVFGLDTKQLSSLEIKHEHHEAEDGIEAFTFVSEQTFKREGLIQVIKAFPTSVLRVKGLVKLESGWQVVNAAYKRVDFSALPSGLSLPAGEAGIEEQGTKIIVIGFKVKQQRELLEEQLKSCVY